MKTCLIFISFLQFFVTCSLHQSCRCELTEWLHVILQLYCLAYGSGQTERIRRNELRQNQFSYLVIPCPIQQKTCRNSSVF